MDSHVCTYVHIYSSLTYSHTKLSLSCQEYCLNKEAWLIYICVHICEYAHSDLDLRIMCVCTWSTEHRVPSIFMLWVFLPSLILLWPTYLLQFWREALQFYGAKPDWDRWKWEFVLGQWGSVICRNKGAWRGHKKELDAAKMDVLFLCVTS